MNRKKWWIAAAAVATVVLWGVLILCLPTSPLSLWPQLQLRLNGQAAEEVAAFHPYQDPGATARLGREDLTAKITVTGSVDVTKPGVYTLQYQVQSGEEDCHITRTVTVVDRDAPELKLKGQREMAASLPSLFQDPGVSAEDRCDGDLTARIRIHRRVEGDRMIVTYRVKDTAGNEAADQRTVLIRDTVAPEITLKDSGIIYLPMGSTYQEPGFTAADDADGDLSAAVRISGKVDSSRAGTYTLTYQVSDKAGNTGSATRTVRVFDASANPSNRVYLTFDDGPSSGVTPQVLDILAANDVKATFFILNYSDDKKPLIQRMIDEGHTVGIHGYSHDYATIYANDEAFMQNVYRLQQRLLEDFGYHATIVRFPGGSSNTVSAAYNQGIMTRLARRLEQEGFTYFDWNVSSGDASAAQVDSHRIYANVTESLRPGRSNVVLMHDANAKQTTADALEDIIWYAKGNGYALLPITPDTEPVHHGIAN